MKVLLPTKKNIPSIVNFLNQGAVAAAPTETAYGLLADATNNQAVKKVFVLKGRRTQKTSALLVANIKMAKKYASFSASALKLAQRYWPGPLTLVLPAKSGLSPLVVKNKYVGLRAPGHNWLLKLLAELNKPLTATSANLAGKKNLYSADLVKKSLARRGLEVLVNGGSLPRRPVSTIVKVVNNRLILLRVGAIKIEN